MSKIDDETGLRLAFAVAAKARAHGNHPFGCVLVDGKGGGGAARGCLGLSADLR